MVQYENLEIKPADMFRLAPMVFLNDTTINFYIKIISKYILEKNKDNNPRKYHFFNTYFCSKLRNEVATMSLSNDLPLCSKTRYALQMKMDPVQKKLKTVDYFYLLVAQKGETL